MKKEYRSYFWLIPISGSIILIDQFTKYVVRHNIPYGGFWSHWPWLTPYFRIVHWYNTGVAFGLLQGQNILFACLALVIASAIFYFYPKFTEQDWLLRVALALQFGGALGNLIDRITIGHVTDFISVGNFAVFNVADSCITVGVLVMIIGIWQKDRQEKRDGGSQMQDENLISSNQSTDEKKPSNIK